VPRSNRSDIPNGLHHVIQRGLERWKSRGLAIWKLGIGGRDAMIANTAFFPPILDFQSA